MPTEKYYFEENYDDAIEFYATHEKNICIRFQKNKETEFTIDLDLETIEEFVLDLTFAIQKLKNEGGQNG
jgi:hypothetical protein